MSDAALPAIVGSASPANAGAVLERVKGFAKQPAVAKSLPFVGLAFAALVALMAWMSFSHGPSRDLFTGLSDSDKAAVADQLKASGISYTLDRDTGALSVPDSDYYRAKMLLAQAGLPKSAPDGEALISSLPMGASRAVEGERLRAAREMDLARTIEAIDAVDTARVHLAAEQQSVFVRDESPPSASVMLRLRQGRTLSDGQVQAIVNLVASSVPGLSPDNVSVVDQAGRLLSHKGGASSDDRQLDMQERMESRYIDAIGKLLTPLVGADGYTTEVHADLDFSESQATRETFPKTPGVIASEKGGWDNNQAGGGQAGGVPGAIANQPPTAAQVSTQPNQTMTPPVNGATQGKTSENYDRTFGLDHEVSVTKNPTGVIKRLSVAVALKQGAKPRTPAELKQIEDLVKGAVGFDQARGDLFALSSRTFVEDAPAAGPKWYEASWTGIAARNGTALAIALLAFFGIAKPLMKRKAKGDAAKAEATADAPPANSVKRVELGGEIANAIASEAATNPDKPVTLDMIEAAPSYADRAALIRNFVRQDPDRAALVVRDLIRADMPAGADANG